jgi:hypothetical protein
MKISFSSKDNTIYYDPSSSIIDYDGFSLPRIYQISKDLKLLAGKTENFEIYKSIYGFNDKAIWIEFTNHTNLNNCFLLGIDLKYLKIDFAEIKNISDCELKSIIDTHLNNDSNLSCLLNKEFYTLQDSFIYGLSVKGVSSFVIRVAYYFNLMLVKKLKEINSMDIHV